MFLVPAIMLLAYLWICSVDYLLIAACLSITSQVTIPGEVTFQLNTDPVTPVFTLTCTSSGGPVTTVSWRRDGIILSDDNTYSITSRVLTDAKIATFNHTLTVTGRLLGQYQCSVSNCRTSSRSTKSLTVGKETCSACMKYVT